MEPLKDANARHITRENQAIPGFQLLPGRDGRNQPSRTNQLDQKQFTEITQAIFGDSLTDQSRIIRHRHLNQKLIHGQRTVRACWQHFVHQQHGDQTGQGSRQSDGQEGKKSDARTSDIFEKATDDQVGRGADQRQRASQNGRIGNRQENLAGGMMRVFAKRTRQRGHNRGVIDECREQHGHSGEAQQGAWPRPSHCTIGQRQQPGQPLKTNRDHQQQQQSHQAFISRLGHHSGYVDDADQHTARHGQRK